MVDHTHRVFRSLWLAMTRGSRGEMTPDAARRAGRDAKPRLGELILREARSASSLEKQELSGMGSGVRAEQPTTVNGRSGLRVI
jgi:hypothetical protein